MSKPESAPRPPDDFSKFLATKEPLLLVGGQAVNVWALYYEDATLDLAPFVSRDVDVLGRRETLREIAALAGVSPKYFSLKPPSNEVGYILPNDATDAPMLIEVLRWVNGVSEGELRSHAVTFSIGEQSVAVHVPSPVVLLQAKLANVDQIKQEGRQDTKHVRILFRIIPEYLNDFAESVRAGRRRERELIDVLNGLLALVIRESSVLVLSSLELEPAVLFETLSVKGLPKVAAFKKHQLSRK